MTSIVRCSDPAEVADAAADRIKQLVDETLQARQQCRISLSGGSTPRALYELLAERGQSWLPWASIALYWGDERVADRSNYEMVKVALLERIDVGAVFPVPTELGGAAAAEKYSETLGETPLDITLLGMGDDGHTASLFPNKSDLFEKRRVLVTESPKPPVERVSISLATINASRATIALITGAAKAAKLRQAYDGAELPFAKVRDAMWIVDEAAASALPGDGT